jgi:hypothetical protein
VTVGLAVIVTTALITGLVVANWNEKEPPRSAAIARPASSATTAARPARSVVTGSAAPPVSSAPAPSAPAPRPKSEGYGDVAEKALIGGAVGAGVGAAGGAIAGGGKGAGKGAAIGGIVGATVGTLYGLHEQQAQ